MSDNVDEMGRWLERLKQRIEKSRRIRFAGREIIGNKIDWVLFRLSEITPSNNEEEREELNNALLNLDDSLGSHAGLTLQDAIANTEQQLFMSSWRGLCYRDTPKG